MELVKEWNSSVNAIVDIHSYVIRTVLAYLFKVNLIQVDIVVSTLFSLKIKLFS